MMMSRCFHAVPLMAPTFPLSTSDYRKVRSENSLLLHWGSSTAMTACRFAAASRLFFHHGRASKLRDVMCSCDGRTLTSLEGAQTEKRGVERSSLLSSSWSSFQGIAAFAYRTALCKAQKKSYYC